MVNQNISAIMDLILLSGANSCVCKYKKSQYIHTHTHTHTHTHRTLNMFFVLQRHNLKALFSLEFFFAIRRGMLKIRVRISIEFREDSTRQL